MGTKNMNSSCIIYLFLLFQNPYTALTEYFFNILRKTFLAVLNRVHF